MNKFRVGGFGERRRNFRRPQENKRRLMLDMGRQRYFRFDLDDILEEFQLSENKSTVAATLLNKMSSHSMDEAFDYVGRLKEDGRLDEAKAERLKNLLRKYSKWR